MTIIGGCGNVQKGYKSEFLLDKIAESQASFYLEYRLETKKKNFKKKVQHYYVVGRLMGVLLTTLAVRWCLSHPSDPSPKFMPT